MEDIEDSEFVASEHDRLVSAISELDKTQHITEPSRNESTNLNSEFNLIKRDTGLNLSSVAKILENTAHHVQISKKLKKTLDGKKVLNKPLEKPQAERIKRATGYEDSKKKVGRWDPVVARSRTVDYVSFPLKNVASKMAPTGDFLSKFEIKSELEKELEEIDPPTVHDIEEEEEQIFPMSYEEMVEHRQQLAKMRAQQSYKAAKAKRQSKIKSKKYHRVLKKERLKQQLKEFEELQKKDPEEALKKLESIEKARALERHTLRHKSTGKWAKNKLIRAKYDTEVRQQLAEQLAVSRSLTQKVQNNESSDDDAEDGNIPDIALSQDPMNPWMMQRSGKSNINAEFDFGYKKYLQNRIAKQKDDSDSDSDSENVEDKPSNELNVLKESINKLHNDQDEERENGNQEEKETKVEISLKRKSLNLKKAAPKAKVIKPTATSEWTVETVNNNRTPNNPSEQILSVFENHENSIAKKVENKLKTLRWNLERLEKASKSSDKKNEKQRKTKDQDNLEYLKLKKNNVKAVIDEELIETTKNMDDNSEEVRIDKPLTNVLYATSSAAQESNDTNIDPNRFIQVKPKYLNTALSQGGNELDQLDDDQVVPRVNIEEVFEEDDVVASFRQEKEDEINKDKLEDVDLSLPGWGAWGGKGVKPQKRKKNRFILKAPPKQLRRDENKGDIIIKEYKDPKLAAHKVKDVPFPFESVKDYEASIRLPLGNTFIPEKAHKKLIRPNVITKAGQIIEPMDEQELLVPKNRNFKNEAVIKLLGKK